MQCTIVTNHLTPFLSRIFCRSLCCKNGQKRCTMLKAAADESLLNNFMKYLHQAFLAWNGAVVVLAKQSCGSDIIEILQFTNTMRQCLLCRCTTLSVFALIYLSSWARAYQASNTRLVVLFQSRARTRDSLMRTRSLEAVTLCQEPTVFDVARRRMRCSVFMTFDRNRVCCCHVSMSFLTSRLVHR